MSLRNASITVLLDDPGESLEDVTQYRDILPSIYHAIDALNRDNKSQFSSKVSLGNTICPRGTCHVTALILDPDLITKKGENPVAEMFSRLNAPLSLLVYFGIS